MRAHEAVLLHHKLNIALVIVVADEFNGRPNTGYQNNHQYGRYDITPAFGAGNVQASHCLEAQIFDHQVGSQRNEHAVDDEQVQRPKKEMQLPVGQAVTSGAQRWHERRGDGYARKYRSALLAAVLQNARQTAEKGDEHIVDGGAGAGLQFRGIHQRQGRHNEKEGGCHQRDEHHDHQVAPGRLEKVQVIGSQRQTGADNGPHERGNQHGANNHCRGIHIEAHRGNDDREGKNPDIGAPEPDTALNALGGPSSV